MTLIIETFLKNSQGSPLIAVVGPTASGKTKISLDIAKKYNGEIINADSKQVYKNIPITTCVLQESERENIPHHLFEYQSPSTLFTVEDHKKDALKVIYDMYKRKKLPILVGGTGLFINALTQNFDLAEKSMDLEIRKKLEEKSTEDLWNELLHIDPEYSKRTHPNNRVRVIRALEYFYTTKKKKSDAGKKEELFSTLILMPKIDREALYEKINNRSELIWPGVLEEAKTLFDQKLDKNLPALKSIGIPEAFAYFRGEITNEEALEKMKQNTRNYAKRQMTWWRGQHITNTIYQITI